MTFGWPKNTNFRLTSEVSNFWPTWEISSSSFSYLSWKIRQRLFIILTLHPSLLFLIVFHCPPNPHVIIPLPLKTILQTHCHLRQFTFSPSPHQDAPIHQDGGAVAYYLLSSYHFPRLLLPRQPHPGHRGHELWRAAEEGRGGGGGGLARGGGLEGEFPLLLLFFNPSFGRL